MCELYYLDQIREAVADKKATAYDEAVATNETVDAAEELMRESKAKLKILPEQVAKFALDLAFIKVTHIVDDEAQKRLIHYATKLCRKAEFDLNERQDFYKTLKQHIEDHIGDD